MLISAKCRLSLFFLATLVIDGCSSAGSRTSSPPNPAALSPAGATTSDVSELYREIGLLAAPCPVAFVRKISSFARAYPDTTVVLVSNSLPHRELKITREGDQD